ncbi:dipeptide ABC transporter ATP-binding protein [Labrys neptuniae]
MNAMPPHHASFSPPLLAFEDLNVWFDLGARRDGQPVEIHVVKNLSLTLAAGECLGLVGESGSGKTTTVQASMGLLPSSARVSGRVFLNGENILEQGDRSVAPHRWNDIAMVFQGAMNAFNPVKTIGWQIVEPMQVHGIASGRAAWRRAEELLELVGIEPSQAKRYPHELSGGMRQRAIIAMALSCNPKVLLTDEPTTALDVIIQDQVLKLLTRLGRELGLGIILVTHDLGVVAQYCHRAAVMLRGEIVEQGTPTELYHRPDHAYTRSLFQATPSLTAIPKPAAPSATGEAPLLSIRDLHVTYPGRHSLSDILRRREPVAKPAVRGIKLEVGRGELVALVGQSGCGKTTTLQTVLGMIRPQAGSLSFEGREVNGLQAADWRKLRRHIQMIYQDPYESLDARFRVCDTVAEPLLIHGLARSTRECRPRVLQALEQVGLSPAETYVERYPHELSGGQRQRVAIAASIILEPSLLLADEPVSMLDVSVRTGILALLRRLCREARMGILMITHDLSTAAGYADRIAVMHQGEIVEQGVAGEIIAAPRHDYTKALLAAIPNPDPEIKVAG